MPLDRSKTRVGSSWTCALVVVFLLAATVQAQKPEPTKPGALVIVGGGGMPDAVREKFMALAGGKSARLVVIPTASVYADDPKEHEDFLKPWRKHGPAKLVLVHTRDRKAADSPLIAGQIADATAVWFSGGDQSKLTEAYRGTAVERELHALLKRGGVIGGTSAGAAVMSDVMITGGNPKAEVGRGFGFVKNAVVDQHFLKRSRINRLAGVVADHPELIGLGIDEATAFVIEGDRWSVLGASYVLAIQGGKDGKPARYESFAPGDRGTLPASGLPVPARSRARDED